MGDEKFVPVYARMQDEVKGLRTGEAIFEFNVHTRQMVERDAGTGALIGVYELRSVG